eukprot:TRINITY_DN1741_c0_g1_i1.p1 TRINITY_DN1741_c0_g1~~TRINITY_DN1741_c0_g1_i1.p1  ORF type:complete len:1251 (-),score=324.83 TRINITY_DN1741_c0_g1_i1:152-3880(-)
MDDHIRVAIRVRPPSNKELVEQGSECVTCFRDQVQIGDKSFAFDHVFGKHSTQEEIYCASVSGMVDSFFKGYNTTIFAYGQTGTGKTYTMGAADDSPHICPTVGIIPRVVEDVFTRIRDSQALAQMHNVEAVFVTKVSYLEIYNETVKDLLHPEIPSKNIVVREDAEGGILVMGMKDEVVTTKEDLFEFLCSGNLQRTTGATLMNECSSRSHSIFTLILEQKQKTEDGTCPPESFMLSKFHLVDLAGSERAKKTGAIGQRLKESVNINSGLLALGNVISALGDTQRKTPVLHVPYRESKLTRLLQDSLGGNSKTLMIACVSPMDTSLEESLNTLRYANRARNIHNKPIVNRDPHLAVLAQLRSELQACKLLLVKHNILLDEIPGITPLEPLMSQGESCGDPAALVQQLRAQVEGLTAEITQLQSEKKQHSCLDVLATEGEDLFGNLLALISSVGDDPVRAQLRSVIADLQQRAARVVPTERAKAIEPCTPRQVLPGRQLRLEPAKRSASKGATPRLRSSSGSQNVRRTSFKQGDDCDESRLDRLQAEYAKLQSHADRLKEDLFQAEWKTVELDGELQQERTEVSRLRDEIKELKRANFKLSRRANNEGDSSPLQPGQDEHDGSKTKVDKVAFEAKCVTWEAEMERMQRERDELANTIQAITEEKRRLEQQAQLLEEYYTQEHEFQEKNLRGLTDAIKEKERLIRELNVRDEEVDDMRRKYERKLQAIEEEKRTLQMELSNTLTVLEKTNIDAVKKERHRQQLLAEYDVKLKQAEAQAQEQRRRLKEKEMQLRQQRQEEAQLRRLKQELQQLREQQERTKQRAKQDAEKAEATKATNQQQITNLCKQLADLERRNRDAELEKKRKDEELNQVKGLLAKERSRAEQEKDALQARIDRQFQQNTDLEKRNRLLDKQIDLSRKRAEATEKLQREVARREKTLRERMEAVSRREALEKQLQEHDMAFTRGLSGWAARIKSLEAEIVKCRQLQVKAMATQNVEKVQAIGEKIAKYNTELETTKAKHAHLREAISEKSDLVFQQNMAAQIRSEIDRIEDLDAALAYGERQIQETQAALQAIENADGDGDAALDAEVEAILDPPASTRPPYRVVAPSSPNVPTLRVVPMRSPDAEGSPESLVGSEVAETGSNGDAVDKKHQHTSDSVVDYKAMLGKYHSMILELKECESRKDQELQELALAQQEDKKHIAQLENVIKLMEANHRRQLSRVQEVHKSEIQHLMEDQLLVTA